MAETLRLGLIGAGRWGRNYIRTIAALPGVRLAALASANPESARLVTEGCRIFTAWRALVEAGGLEGLIVATPPETHAEIAAAAIERRLPVLVEKPLTLDTAQAAALVELARRRSAIAWCAHTHLFHPAYRALKASLARFGAIREIQGEAGNAGPFRADTPVLWDWGSHDIAMCLDLTGEMPWSSSARLVESKAVDSAHGETIEVTLEFSGGVRARLLVSNLLQARRRRLVVRCANGELVYDDNAADKLTAAAAGSTRARVEISDELPLAVAVREFAAAAAALGPDSTSLELGARVVQVLAACEAAG